MATGRNRFAASVVWKGLKSLYRHCSHCTWSVSHSTILSHLEWHREFRLPDRSLLPSGLAALTFLSSTPFAVADDDDMVRESEMVPLIGGRHFGNLRFFASGVLGVLSSHLEKARTLFGALPFPRLDVAGKLIFKIWDFLLLSLLLLMLMPPTPPDLLLKAKEKAFWRFLMFDFASRSSSVGMSLMLKI